MKIDLKFWQAGPVLTAVAGILGGIWDRILDGIGSLKNAVDAESCPAPLLRLLAWERGIEPLEGEDETLFRLRVKYAAANARDAGSIAGFARIFERLGLGSVIQTERAYADDWDVIECELASAVFLRVPGLFGELVKLYGRTCRRYVYTVHIDPAGLRLRPFEYAGEITIATVRIEL